MEWLRKNVSLLSSIGAILAYLLMGAYQVGAYRASSDQMKAEFDKLNNRVDNIEVILMQRH